MKRNRFKVEAMIRMLREVDGVPASREEHRSKEPGGGDYGADLLSLQKKVWRDEAHFSLRFGMIPGMNLPNFD